ncbi:unnamed protein product [Trichogramma brassicae]|uniref:BTB domain-containing protein n=1 Tax=Trichogramma brassicae TaxID=86971 RepID=A0A6H5IQ30_9HYME|nr:unnamed protein product [Trichogramma brassicae]
MPKCYTRESTILQTADLKVVPAHRVVLAAASPVFKAMFNHDMLENKTQSVDMNDISYDAAVEMLRYIYTGAVKNALHVIRASTKITALLRGKPSPTEPLDDRVQSSVSHAVYHLAQGFNIKSANLRTLMKQVPHALLDTHKTTCPITCLCGHPEEATVAVRDSLGRVIVWKDLLNIPAKATYHWHSLPVTVIAFSSSGKDMLTGGGEAVLVKWILAKPQDRRYLPRLPAMVKHISIAPDNVLIAISTLDNDEQIIH